MKVALVYDRVVKWGGAERVLLVLHEMFPDAPLYTAVFDSGKTPWAKVFPKVIPTYLQKISLFRSFHELLAPLVPMAFETFDFSGFDLVISVTSEAGKGIITKPPTKHICYCLTPTRYLWSARRLYNKDPQKPFNLIPFYSSLSKPFLSYTRGWDQIASARPDVMVAISTAVRKRIKKYYYRDSQVIYPPVDTQVFKKASGKLPRWTNRSEYFLVVSRLVPYKKADLVIRAFNLLGLPLVVVGIGSQKRFLKRIAKSNIKFTGFVNDRRLVELYKGARALIYPQVEDFGMTSVEAQALGVPVIALKKGGAQDTVIEGKTGIFFDKQTVDSLVDAVKRFDRMKFKTQNLVDNAENFSKNRFKKNLSYLINNA